MSKLFLTISLLSFLGCMPHRECEIEFIDGKKILDYDCLSNSSNGITDCTNAKYKTFQSIRCWEMKD